MANDLENLSQNLYCMRSELLEPAIIMNGACKLLISKIPELTDETINQIGKISDNLLSQIHSFPETTIDLQSLGNAANQLQSLAIQWEKNLEELSGLLNRVKTVDYHLEDADLENKLKEIISNGLQKLKGYIQHLKIVQTEHLSQDDGWALVLNIDIEK